MTFSIALAGNPNSGKTTVFNALTGARQQVGNWPGVTVERKSGVMMTEGHAIEVVDLPGVYSLTQAGEGVSVDEQIASRYVAERKADLVINIVDAGNLERNLYLTMQLLEMRVPVIVAVNMMDMAEKRGLGIDLAALEKMLGCPVVPLLANRRKGIDSLRKKIVSMMQHPVDDLKFPEIEYSECVKKAVRNLSEHLQKLSLRARSIARGNPVESAESFHDTDSAFSTGLPRAMERARNDSCVPALQLLENDLSVCSEFSAETLALAKTLRQKICEENNGIDADILIADARYQFIQKAVANCVSKISRDRTLTARIDRIVLNRIFGIPIFLAVMYAMFFFAINIGGAFQDFFDIGSDTLFVSGFAHWLTSLHAPVWLIAFLAEGIGRGINTTITFIPVIGAMFLFLALLEDSGYMARAAFVVDRLMRALGLPGKSFVPMIVGFGCNVPAVMATRTLENRRDRILTVMMSPFISCGARLAIYAVFTAAFFPVGGQNIVFLLYALGILMAVFTGFLLRKTILSGDPAPLVLELPPYHMPNMRSLALHAWQRLRGFVSRAGRMIIPVCILIGALNTVNMDGTLNNGEGSSRSLLSASGRLLTPVFAPMGLNQENWPATVGLVTGVLAKEVVIGTLNTLYSQAGNLATGTHSVSVSDGLRTAFASIPANFAALGKSFGNPVMASAPVHALSQEVYGLMYQRFDGKIGAFAYLLFVLLYFPCISTTAAMLREVGRGWAIFSVAWSTGVAWCAATGFYQMATFARHPFASLCWTAGVVMAFLLVITGVHFYGRSVTWRGKKYEPAGVT